MAIVECIPEKKQTPSAQKGVIDYCMQPSKTYDEDEQLAYVSGYNCVPALANESFLATQKVFGHEPDGIRFYHYVQSFKIGEDISPQEAHEIGKELACGFGKREVLVATHIDREHIHNHLVVCAYDLESGMKLHNNKYFLGELRKLSDTICKAHGLAVLEAYDPHTKSTRPGPKEYRAALNGNSWKIQLCVAIDHCMKRCKRKGEFLREMKKLGYDVIWTPERKYITYIRKGEDGTEKRVRDNKLHEDKYRKENMEYEFIIRAELYGQAQDEERSAYPSQEGGGTTAYRSDPCRGLAGADGGHRALRVPEQRADGAEGSLGGRSEPIHPSHDEGGGGTESGDREGHAEGRRTGWERERESLGGDRQENPARRVSVVASPRAYSHSRDLGLALVGAGWLGDITNMVHSGDESEDERRQREARETGEAFGSLAGLAVGAAIHLAKQSDDDTQEVDEVLDEEEDHAFDLTM